MGATCCVANDDDRIEMAAGEWERHLKSELFSKSMVSQTIRETRSMRPELSQKESVHYAVLDFEAHQREYDLTMEVLQNVDRSVYEELRRMYQPPEVLYNILACAALILGETDVEWKSLQKFLLRARNHFCDFDFYDRKRENVEKAMQFADNIPNFYDTRQSASCSQAGFYIFCWVRDVFEMHRQQMFLESQGVQWERESHAFINSPMEQSPMLPAPLSPGSPLSDVDFEEIQSEIDLYAMHKSDTARSTREQWDMEDIWEHQSILRRIDELAQKAQNMPPDELLPEPTDVVSKASG